MASPENFPSYFQPPRMHGMAVNGKPVPSMSFNAKGADWLDYIRDIGDMPMIHADAVTVQWQREETVWEFPRERFVTYEPSDERMCRFCGWGREVTKTVTYSQQMYASAQIPLTDSSLISVEFTGTGTGPVERSYQLTAN